MPKRLTTVDGKPAEWIGVWAEHPDVSVYVVREGLFTWHVWADVHGQVTRVSKAPRATKGGAKSLAFAHGVTPPTS